MVFSEVFSSTEFFIGEPGALFCLVLVEPFRLNPTGGGPMNDLLGRSITYRVALGGEKVFTLQTVTVAAEQESRGMSRASAFPKFRPRSTEKLRSSGDSPVPPAMTSQQWVVRRDYPHSVR
jgi:hypothetical protein